jgi:V-type H+-transporting ATPase subunit a
MTNNSSLFRSEEMSLIQLYIPYELAPSTCNLLGEQGLIEFRDLNPQVNAFQRSFVGEIRRFVELERKLRFFQSQLEKTDIRVAPLPEIGTHTRLRSPREIDDLAQAITLHENRLLELNNSYTKLMKRNLELTEMRHVLNEAESFFQKVGLF